MKDLINKYVGKYATIWAEYMMIDVVIKDVKIAYGRTRFLVSPVSGNGETWVENLKLT